MRTHRLLIGFTLSFILSLAACPAPAEEVIEAWRSPFGAMRCVSVNHSDGSCWLASYYEGVVHLAEDGTELLRVGGFQRASAVSVNPTDRSCWVAGAVGDWGDSHYWVVHLPEDGTVLWRSADLHYPVALSVNLSDSSCWVADSSGHQVVHLASNGTELWRGGLFGPIDYLCVDSADGSCWVSDHDNCQVVRLVIPGWEPPVFYDVPWYFWAFDEIGACSEAGIVGGYTPTSYEPTWSVGRSQMAVFISRAFDLPL